LIGKAIERARTSGIKPLKFEESYNTNVKLCTIDCTELEVITRFGYNNLLWRVGGFGD